MPDSKGQIFLPYMSAARTRFASAFDLMRMEKEQGEPWEYEGTKGQYILRDKGPLQLSVT